MKSNIKMARLAGFIYLLNVILGTLYIQFIPSEIAVWGDPQATLNNFIGNEMLFRSWLVIGILVHIDFIILPLLLYRLLNQINKNVAIFMVAFALVSVPISYSFMLDEFKLLEIFTNYNAFGPVELENAGLKILTTLEQFYDGFILGEIFWGLWLFPFGYLVFKSGFLPKVLGVALMLGCVAYLIDVTGIILFKNFHEHVNSELLLLPATIGEVGICLWLLLIGPRKNLKF